MCSICCLLGICSRTLDDHPNNRVLALFWRGYSYCLTLCGRPRNSRTILPHAFRKLTGSPMSFGLIWPLLHRFYLECLNQKMHKSSKVKGEFSSTTHQPTHILSSHTHHETHFYHHLSCGTRFRRVCGHRTCSPQLFYDNGQTSMNSVACSNGVNGLVTKGYPTFGSLPSFPFIGGAFAVGAWNSTECGSCWELTYPAYWRHCLPHRHRHSLSGFDVSDETMNTLTNGVATE
jgi:hypothetical protein